MKKIVLMAIKPKYASLIKSGEKTVELRRVAPKIKKGDIIAIYESAPVSKITSVCDVKKLYAMNPEELWKKVKQKAMISKKEFKKYFKDKDIAYGIKITDVKVLEETKTLEEIGKKYAPQSFYYLTEKELEKITQREGEI